MVWKNNKYYDGMIYNLKKKKKNTSIYIIAIINEVVVTVTAVPNKSHQSSLLGQP